MSMINLLKKPQAKIIAAVVAAFLVVGWTAYTVMAGRATYVLEVNGQALGVVQGKAIVRAALAELKAEASKDLGRPVRAGRQVALVRYTSSAAETEATAPGTGAGQTGGKPGQTSAAQGQANGAATAPQGLAELSNSAAVREALRTLSPLATDGFMIKIEGQDVVGLLNKDEAQAVVDELKAEEAMRIKQRGGSVASLEIEQRVTVEAAPIPLDKLRAKDEAKRILARGTDKIETYVVSRGDSLWTIANRHGMTVDTLLKANPEIRNSATISPGQKLNLIAASPYISIVSVEVKTVKEWIPFPVQVVEDATLWPWQVVVQQPGVGGQKEVTYRIERRTSDRQQKTSVLSERILSEPKVQVEVHGTKRAPDLGTGTLYWPVPTGRLTSGFGWRRLNYHTGIDLGAPRGTEVSAADGGTIVFLGTKGRYGRTIMIDHGGGHIVTLYGHLNGFAAGLTEGSTVQKGQLIGYVGSSGNSTGPHLHFEVRIDGKPVNPLTYYPAR